MDSEPVRLGRISRPIEKALGKDFGTNIWIYVTAADLGRFCETWRETYLSKLEEAARIIRNPYYVAYAEKYKKLFLLKEYFADGEFRKAGLLIADEEGQWHLKDIFALTPSRLSEISGMSVIVPMHE
jgi:hypothetical protein